MAKEAIQDIIALNHKIEKGHLNGEISYKNYSDTVKPIIDEFSKRYGTTPNKYLKRFLSPIFDGLPSGFELKNYQHYGNNKLHDFVWACIYFKYPNVKSLYASSSPQLYVLIHSNGIKFGFDYGAQIEKDSELVEKAKGSPKIQDLIVDICKSIKAYKLVQGADYLAQEKDLVSLQNRSDVIQKWENSIHLLKQYNSHNIPDNIDIEIIETFETLKPLLIEICNIDLPSDNNVAPNKNKLNNVKFNSKLLIENLSSSGLSYSNKLLIRFIASLLTKPFVILTGLSGSGKTKLAQAFVQWICQDKSQYAIVPVGADWTNREPLLGYPNALKPDEYVKPDSNVLDLIIRANNHPELPFFLILDEMNLSHVERYFADFLSVMESKEGIPLYSEGTIDNGVPSKLSVPSNFFIIGTVNIDETTNMFSPKVLDRANTIEFRVTDREMANFLDNIREIDMDALNTKGASMANSFLQMTENKSFPKKDSEEINKTLVGFFGELKKTGAEFGYRSATEMLGLINQLTVLDNNLTTKDKVDIAIMQKLLPKLHGSRRKLCPVLEILGSFCLEGEIKIVKEVFAKEDFDYNSEQVLYPLSLEKIARMHKGAVENGFASFAEA